MIAKMSRLRLAGLKSDYAGVIDILTESRQFEFRSAPLTTPLSDEEIEKVKIDQTKLSFAIDLLNKFNDEAKEIIKKSKKKKESVGFDYVPYAKDGVRKIIDFDRFDAIEQKKDELDRIAETLKQISFRRIELKTQAAEWATKRKEYAAYVGLPFGFETVETEKTISSLWFSSKKNALIDPIDEIYFEPVPVAGGVVAFVVCLKSDFERTCAEMSKSGFMQVPYKAGRVDDLILECDNKSAEIKREERELLIEGLSYEKYLLDFMIYYDLLGIRTEQKSALNNSVTTVYTFVLDGWVPRETCQNIVREIESKYEVCTSVSEALPEDEPPTLVINNKLVAPFENITNMYTVPAYTEKDPNPHMAIWYFLLFGVMCGDVVYGLLLTIACILILKIKKFEPSTASLIKMFAICGVSSALWGVAFDSYLGYSVGFGWFVPMERPMILLGLSLVLGMLQIAYGYILGVIRCIRERNVAAAIFDMGLMLVVIVAIGLLAANIFVGIFTTGEFDMSGQFIPSALSSMFSKIGLILLLVAIVGIFLTAGRASKSIGGKIGNGLYGVYGLVNLISDILSYCRLFGLGLAGGAIAYAFNTLMDTIFFSSGAVISFIFGAILSLVLHVFNLAISLLGAYVHNARLQMLEFYGKFLLGDGREFTYVGQNTRYVRFI